MVIAIKFALSFKQAKYLDQPNTWMVTTKSIIKIILIRFIICEEMLNFSSHFLANLKRQNLISPFTALIWVTILDLDTFTVLAYTESKGNREGEESISQVLKKWGERKRRAVN